MSDEPKSAKDHDLEMYFAAVEHFQVHDLVRETRVAGDSEIDHLRTENARLQELLREVLSVKMWNQFEALRTRIYDELNPKAETGR